MNATLHRKLSVHAAASGLSFNDLINTILRRALHSKKSKTSATLTKSVSQMRRETMPKDQQVRLTLYTDPATKRQFMARVTFGGPSASLLLHEIATAWLTDRPAIETRLVSDLIRAKKVRERL